MTVAELIELLKTMPPDKEVTGRWSEWNEIRRKSETFNVGVSVVQEESDAVVIDLTD